MAGGSESFTEDIMDSGDLKIEWARQYMPVLGTIAERLKR